MSASIVVVIPVALFMVVLLACFVGCKFPTSGLPRDPFYQYQNTVTGTAGLVGFWPLDETTGTTAFDISGNQFNGTYTVGPNVPTYNAAEMSDAAPGTFTLGQPNIVAGDSSGNSKTTLNPCAAFNGGFVNVPWAAALGPSQFTIEVWVVPNWTAQDAQSSPSYRTVLSSEAPSASQGFTLFASPQNLWTAGVGIGSEFQFAVTGSDQTIVQGSVYFLVVTYDGSMLTLYVNPPDATEANSGQMAASGFMPAPSPTALYIGMSQPTLGTQRWPFNGRIQDVAIYSTVLDGTTINTHYLNGQAMSTG